MMAERPLLTLNALTAAYGNTAIVKDFTLDIVSGEIVTVLGANDSGKTTLFLALSRLIPIWSGSIWFDGHDVTALSLESLVQLGIAFLPQQRLTFNTMSVEDNLKVGAFTLPQRSSYQMQRDYIFELFPRLAERRQHKAKHLSGGEQRLLEIARAIMSRPRLLILDQPSAGLAPYIRWQMLEGLQTLKQDTGLSILILEQAIPQVMNIADRGCMLVRGMKTFEGTREELIEFADIDSHRMDRADYP